MPFVKVKQVPEGYRVFSIQWAGIPFAPYFAPKITPATAPIVSASRPKLPARVMPERKSLCMAFRHTKADGIASAVVAQELVHKKSCRSIQISRILPPLCSSISKA